VPVVGSIIGQFSGIAGFIAACIAIGGFLGHTRPALRRQDDLEVRRATVIGGLWGLAASIFLAVVSA
jgi:hypothetical protein